MVGRRQIQVPTGPLLLERAWAEALALLDLGSLHPGPLSVQAIHNRLVEIPAEALLMASGSTHDLSALRARVGQLQADEQEELSAPWPGWDLERGARGSWVWSPYSPERLVERTSAVYEGALEAYEDIVTLWLPNLRHRMRVAVTLPAILRGQLHFTCTGPRSCTCS